jgi:hypothetical protein
MQWRNGAKKGAKKGGKKGAPARGFTIALFGSLFRALFFPFPAELQVGPCFCWSSTLFVLLIEKGKKKTGQKTKRMAKRAKKGTKKGAKEGYCEQP